MGQEPLQVVRAGATAPQCQHTRQKEGMGIWRNWAQPEEMCAGGKGTCRTKGCLSFNPASPTPLLPACMWTNPPPCWVFAQCKCHLLEYLLLQLFNRGAGEQPSLWLLFLSKLVLTPGTTLLHDLEVWCKLAPWYSSSGELQGRHVW